MPNKKIKPLDEIPSRGKDEKNSVEDDFEIIAEDEEKSSFKISDTKKLKEKLKKCTQERQEYLLGWQRAKADFINARKKDEETRKRQVKYASEDIVSQLLPAIDSFDMAFRDKKAWEKVDANWRKGIEHIHSQILKILKDNGLSQIDPLGKIFDPICFESVELIKVKEKDKDGIILEVVQYGYELNGKSVRPAQVKVGVYKVKSL